MGLGTGWRGWNQGHRGRDQLWRPHTSFSDSGWRGESGHGDGDTSGVEQRCIDQAVTENLWVLQHQNNHIKPWKWVDHRLCTPLLILRFCPDERRVVVLRKTVTHAPQFTWMILCSLLRFSHSAKIDGGPAQLHMAHILLS